MKWDGTPLMILMDRAMGRVLAMPGSIHKIDNSLNHGVQPQSSFAKVLLNGTFYVGQEGMWYYAPAKAFSMTYKISSLSAYRTAPEDKLDFPYGISEINGKTPVMVRDKEAISRLNKMYAEWQISHAAPDFMSHLPD